MGTRLLAFALAGYLIASIGIAATIAFRVLFLIPAIIVLLPMQMPPVPPQSRDKSLWQELFEGLSYLKGDKEEMLKRVDHIGIAVRNLDEAVRAYKVMFGIEPEIVEVNNQFKVRVAFIPVGEVL
jgi:hypothetical protein